MCESLKDNTKGIQKAVLFYDIDASDEDENIFIIYLI